MLIAFVDETSDKECPDYFGLCVATVNAVHYRGIKASFQKILLDDGWNPEIEFKGSYLFSAKKGCLEVPVEKRVRIASEILKLTASSKNTKMKFFYLRVKTTEHTGTYLDYLPSLLKKALPLATKKGGKDLLNIHCDYRNDISAKAIRDVVLSVVCERGYTLFEDINVSRSGFHTVGILYADIVAYLQGRIDIISTDSDLFENITEEDYERHGRLKKLRSSRELIAHVRNINRYVTRTT